MHGHVYIHVVKLYDSAAGESHEQYEKLQNRVLV